MAQPNTRPLTPREEQVLQFLWTGLRPKEVAFAMGLRLRTITVHTGNIYRKLGVDSLIKAVRAGVRMGILDYPSMDSFGG